MALKMLDDEPTKEEIKVLDLVPDVLGVKELDTDLYIADQFWKAQRARGTFGGQIIGQALMSASRTVADNLNLHSIHSYFLRPGDPNSPVIYKVSRTRDGGSFSSRSISAIQKGRPILTLQASFHNEAAEKTNIFDYQVAMPKVAHHSQLSSVHEYLALLLSSFENDSNRAEKVRNFMNYLPIDIKPLDVEVYMGNKSNSTKNITSWFKVRNPIGDNQNEHRAAASYISDWSLLYSSTVHQSKAPVSMMVSLDHSIWFHRPFRIDEWVLYEAVCDNMANSRSLCQGRIWTESGELVATVMQEGLVRGKL
ncbi:ACOT8 [Bugula neritina]|uniref:ACOT8 n=1 Tax=Bugula neritina TaxID=10212 RepID=A0A7J7KRV7_BUGNE|nr:ACOT8 [Bugula neritina]